MPSGAAAVTLTTTIAVAVVAGLPSDRADKCITEALRRLGLGVSRSTVQRWMAEGRVVLGARPVAPKQALALGATVYVTPAPSPPSEASPDPTIALTVVYEDEDLLVIDKPAGLVVHPARGHPDGTLVNALLARPGFAVGEDRPGPPRPGIVHRLDKGTSGLMVVAKNERTREGLKALFAAHDIERAYVAIVVGVARDQTFDTAHGRHRTDRLRFTSIGCRSDARRAVTHVRVVERFVSSTVVECTLETGRTHQIRVHLAERSKTPILGDPLYGRRPSDAALAAYADQLGRQALHARVLGFVHPIQRRAFRWESPLPDDIAEVLSALRG